MIELSISEIFQTRSLRPARMPVPSQGQTFSTPGGIRTHNQQGLNLLPLPVGLQELVLALNVMYI